MLFNWNWAILWSFWSSPGGSQCVSVVRSWMVAYVSPLLSCAWRLLGILVSELCASPLGLCLWRASLLQNKALQHLFSLWILFQLRNFLSSLMTVILTSNKAVIKLSLVDLPLSGDKILLVSRRIYAAVIWNKGLLAVSFGSWEFHLLWCIQRVSSACEEWLYFGANTAESGLLCESLVKIRMERNAAVPWWDS